MSDQEFEFEKQIANVSQLKSFANFKNNYNKKLLKQPQELPRETITKSNQKLSNSYQKSKSYEKQPYQPQEEKKMKVIREEPEATDFYQNYPQMNNRQHQEKQRSTQEIIPQRPRIRPRQFSQTPTYQQTSLNTSLSHSQRQFHPLKQTIQPMIQQSYYNPSAPISQTSLPQEQPSSNASYKAKFQQLSSTFQQFKTVSLIQKRKQKQQSFQNQETIQRLKVRVYELEIREDELIMENKKLNEKLTKDFKSEKESQSLKSILESRTEELRRAVEEINYYRGQLEGNRKQLQSSNLDSERYALQLRELRERLEYQQMEIENKERLQVELSQKISGLIKQNARLRDEVSQLFRGNKELEYQNYSMKRELKRGGETGDSYNQYVNQRQSQTYNRGSREQESVIEQPRPDTKRRRGEFNQQRNKVNERREVKQVRQVRQIKQVKQARQPKQKQTPARRQQTSKIEPNPSQQLYKRKQELEQQIAKMKQQKPMNGAMRRAKINLQKQLQQVINKLTKINSQ